MLQYFGSPPAHSSGRREEVLELVLELELGQFAMTTTTTTTVPWGTTWVRIKIIHCHISRRGEAGVGGKLRV